MCYRSKRGVTTFHNHPWQLNVHSHLKSSPWPFSHPVSFHANNLFLWQNFTNWVFRYLLLKTICKWAASSEFGAYRLCEQRRFRRACASAQSRQNLRCSLIQPVSQEEPSDRKPNPKPLWMAGHAQLKFVMTECLKTQIRLTRHKYLCSIIQGDIKHAAPDDLRYTDVNYYNTSLIIKDNTCKSNPHIPSLNLSNIAWTLEFWAASL